MERKRGRMQASIRMVGNLTHQPSDRTTIRSGGPLDSSAREREREITAYILESGAIVRMRRPFSRVSLAACAKYKRANICGKPLGSGTASFCLRQRTRGYLSLPQRPYKLRALCAYYKRRAYREHLDLAPESLGEGSHQSHQKVRKLH